MLLKPIVRYALVPLVAASLVTASFVAAAAAAEQGAKGKPKERSFRLTYGATVVGLPAGAKARVWLPVPTTNRDQTAKVLTTELPATGDEGTEERFGNTMLSFEMQAPKSGEITFGAAYQVTRKEVHGLPPEKMGMQPVKLSDDQRKLLLSADS